MTMAGKSFIRQIVAVAPNPEKRGKELLTLACGHTVSKRAWDRQKPFSLCKPCEDHWRWEQVK